MNKDTKRTNDPTTKIIIAIIIIATIGVGGWLFIEHNKTNQESKKDPEKILGYTIGEVSGKYCSGTNVKYSKFYITDRVFDCYDFDDLFTTSDLNNYILSSYSYSAYNGSGSFYFEVDKTQTDLRPLKIDNPEQFVGQMATALCPKYSLAEFKIFAAGEHMGISTIPCKDINQYSMYQDVVITDAYYGADEKSGDNPDEYYEQNNAKGTRKLYFDSEYMSDRLQR